MEYEKSYVFQPSEKRPAKRRRTEPQGLQASWNLRREAYRAAWQVQQESIDARLDNINSAVVGEITAFLDGAIDDTHTSRVPCGIVVAGPSSASHSGFVRRLARSEGSRDAARIFASLSSSCGSNLKALLKALIQKATSRPSGAEDDEDEVRSHLPKGGKLLNYDLQLLCDYVRKHQIQQVVIAFEDTEAFDSDLLSELIELLGYWRDRIPFVCLFSIATSVDFLQQRLSRTAVKCVNGRLFDVAPSSEVREQVLAAITDGNAATFIGPDLLTSTLERQTDYVQGIDSFVDTIKYAYMSGAYANALSLFLIPGLEFNDVPSDHFEALRTLDSFRGWARQLLDDNELTRVKDMLEDDELLFHAARSKLTGGRHVLGNMGAAVDVIRTLQESLPNTAVSARSSLYIQAMSGRLAGSAMLRSLLLTARKVPSDVAIMLVRRVIDVDLMSAYHTDCAEVTEQLSDLIQAQADGTQPLRSADDVKNSTLRTTVVAQKVELSKQKSAISKQDTAYTAILRRFTDILERVLTVNLVNPKDLVFHEIFLYDLKSPHREVFTPRPRHAVERALASPHDYLDCDCCAPSQGEREEATLAATQPATAVLYQLYLESGSLINASDLWQAFNAVMGEGEDEKRTMALFQRGLAELRQLGFVKSTRKRVDHIAKVAWRGL